MSDAGPGFATLAIHAGARAAARETDAGEAFGTLCEERVAALEGGTAAVALAAGSAAPLLVLRLLLGPGDTFVAVGAARNPYAAFGWALRSISGPEELADVLSPRTKAICVDAIGPDGRRADLAAYATAAHAAHVPLVVDNSWATAALVRPIEEGADIVTYGQLALTAGQPRAEGGLIVDGGSFDWLADARFPTLSLPTGDDAAFGERFGNFALAMACRTIGLRDISAPLSAPGSERVVNGLATLALRLARHGATATTIGDHLAAARDHRVTHPDARSGILHVGCDDPDRVLARLGRLGLFDIGCFGGGARSAADRVGDGLRLWVGLEDADDLIADLDQALAG